MQVPQLRRFGKQSIYVSAGNARWEIDNYNEALQNNYNSQQVSLRIMR